MRWRSWSMSLLRHLKLKKNGATMLDPLNICHSHDFACQRPQDHGNSSALACYRHILLPEKVIAHQCLRRIWYQEVDSSRLRASDHLAEFVGEQCSHDLPTTGCA